MTHPHEHQMFIAHVMEPGGGIVDCIIGSEKGAPMEEVRERFERFLDETQEPGHVVVAFHELEPEPAPVQIPHVDWPSAVAAMVIKGYALVMVILSIIRYLHRRSN